MTYSVCFLFVLFLLVNTWEGTAQCVKTSTCTCKKGNGDTIDLSALSTDNGTPRFQNVTDIRNMDIYSLSVCNYFSQGGCDNVAVCQIRPRFPSDPYIDIGDLSTAVFMENEIGQITINYTAGNRQSLVSLTCNHIIEAQLIVLGEQPPQSSIYHFELISKYACLLASPDLSSTYTIAISVGASVVCVGIMIMCAIVIFTKRLSLKCIQCEVS